MLPQEVLSVLLFLTLVGAVFLTASLMLFLQIRVWRSRRPPLSRTERRTATVSWSLAALGIACFLYGHIEPYWPEITTARIVTDKLATGQSLRIVHLSDIHSDPEPRLEPDLAATIASQKPDLIVFTGDSINSPEGLPVFKQLMRQLSAVAPTYVVRGNWDVWHWSRLDLFGDTGVTDVGDRVLDLRVRDVSFRLGGLVADSPARDRILAELQGPALSVLLHHYPDEADAAAAAGIDLYCAGHTHGGQVALPLYGALVTLSRFGKRFEAGLYRVEKTWLYVSRGIGMEGGPAPRVRFWARPEVAVLEVEGASR